VSSSRQGRGGAGRIRFVAASIASAAVLVAGCASGSARPAAPSAAVGQQLDRPLPNTVLHTTLLDPAGRAVTLSSMHGKIIVLSDMMTLCQETCPLDTVEVVSAARAVQRAGLGDRVVFLSVTVDPARDTRTRIAAYRRLFAPVPADWRVLTGTPAGLAALWKQLGVFVQKAPEGKPAGVDWLTGRPLTYDVTHSDAVFMIDGSGRERFVLLGSPHVAAGAKLPPALRRFLNDEGRANLNHPEATAWTLAGELDALSWLTGHRIAAPPPG
jgi:protein SCO1/2